MSLQRYPLHAEALGPFKSAYLALLETIHLTFGVDPVLIIEGALGLTAAATFLNYAGNYLYHHFQRFYVSSVQIQESDLLYGQMMRWMTDNQLTTLSYQSARATTLHKIDSPSRRRRRLRSGNAIPPPGRSWESEDDETDLDENFDPERLTSYRGIVGRMHVHLQPFESSHFFRHQGRWIRFYHNIQMQASQFAGEAREMGTIRLQCLGRTLKPIEDLLMDVQMYNMEHSKSVTTVFRALALHGGMHQWIQVVSRPSRDIRTVILDKAKKYALLKDINEYLHPRTRRWYSNHGIPYRRGYLFSGAPGTGKTSLTSAIAGIFGLNIYVLSLLDPAMTESQLASLMSQVPSHCILLLEDIDAAGLGKRSEISASPQPLALPSTPNGADSDSKMQQPTGISLSALLNAIDGVASNEGRVLIMTTNSPDTLDAALIRPGRIDMRVHFDLPSRAEIEELFLSMYSEEMEQQRPKKDPRALPPSTSVGHAKGETEANGSAIKPGDTVAETSSANDSDAEKSVAAEEEQGERISDLRFVPPERMRDMAVAFSKTLPEGKLNLADIQGFMLGHKRNPVEAVKQVGAWAGERMGEKGEKGEGELGDTVG